MIGDGIAQVEVEVGVEAGAVGGRQWQGDKIPLSLPVSSMASVGLIRTQLSKLQCRT